MAPSSTNFGYFLLHPGRCLIALAVSLLGAFSFSVAGERVGVNINLEFESETLARRGDTVITEAEVNARIDQIAPEHRRGFLEDPDRFVEMLGAALVEKALSDQFVASDDYSEVRTRAGLHRDLVRQTAELQREHYIEARLLDDYSNRARELYIANRDQYRNAPTISFRQIALIKTRRDHDEVPDLAARLFEELKRGAEFERLALEWSDDPAVDRNGGFYEKRQVADLNPEVGEALESLSEGERMILDSPRAILILELVRRTPGQVPPYEELAEQLQQRARERHRERLHRDYVSALTDAELKIPDGAIRRFLQAYDVDWAPPADLGSN